MPYHLAQLNIARMLAPLDDPSMAEFVAQLDDVNALADRSPGFVWRLQDDSTGDATYLRPFEDDMILVNMSVWESIDALKEFVYKNAHGAVYRDRTKWFSKMGEAHMAMWWIRAGTVPTIEEAKERLAHVRAHGETAFAFTFRHPHPPPGEEYDPPARVTIRAPVGQ